MPLFVELSIILAVTTVIAALMRALKQPLAVGYIIAGVVVGPYVLDVLHAHDSVDLFSKIGIAVLLFIVGLNLNPDTIKETGRVAVVTGMGQIVFTSSIGFLLAWWLGFGTVEALYIAIALTFSSTIIVLKLLSDKGDLGKLYGKISIGFLLVQDIVATLLLIVVPLVGAQAALGGAPSNVFLDLFIKGVVLSLLLYFISRVILPHVARFLATAQELLFLFSIAWGLGLAAFFAHIGFSIEIGALIAGVTLSVSPFSTEIASRLRSLRDFFIVLFFVLLGAHLSFDSVGDLLPMALALSLFVLVGNPLIVFVLMNLMGYRSRTAFLAGLTVAQISEFSLILMGLGFAQGHVSQEAVSVVTIVGILTIAGSTYLILYGEKIHQRIKPFLRLFEFRSPPRREPSAPKTGVEMIIFGYGRVGYEFVEVAKELGLSYVVVDYNPSTMADARGDNVNFVFGDAEDVEFLEELALPRASVVVSTIPDHDVNMLLVHQYRRNNKDGAFIALSHHVHEVKDLYDAGASYVVLPHWLGAAHASTMITKYHNEPASLERARHRHITALTKQGIWPSNS